MFKAIMLWGVLLAVLLTQSPVIHAQSEDIPTCGYTRGVFYQANHFPRYDFATQRVVMVDLATREEVRELGTGIPAQNYWVQGWSPECQYLSMAFSSVNDQGIEFWDTIIWDVVNGGQLGRLEGARLVPFPMTWDTNSTQILVETRHGAYLWKLGGGQVWLTGQGDYNGRSFRQGTLKWDYANNQLSGVLSIDPLGSALYDMGTGELLAITDRLDRPLEVGSRQTFGADGDGERYRCTNRGLDGLTVSYNVPTDRLILQDSNTHDAVFVLDENLAEMLKSTLLYQVEWRNDCRFLFVRFGIRDSANQDLLVYDLQANQRVLFLPNERIRQPHIDPTGQYMVITTGSGAKLYHLNTGAVFPLFARLYNDRFNNETAFNELTWDIDNNQLEIMVSVMNSRNHYIQVHDLQTGALIQTLDYFRTPRLQVDEELAETQRNAPYACNWFVQYRPQIQSIVLVHNFSREVLAVVEDNLLIDRLQSATKSPDCRYVIGVISTGNHTFDTVVWDLADGRRTAVFEGAEGIPYPINYSPYSNHAIVSTNEGAFWWDYTTDARHQLNNASIVPQAGRPNVSTVHQLEWIPALGQVLMVTVDRGDVVQAFDVATGQKVAEFGGFFDQEPIYFEIRPHHVILVTSKRYSRGDWKLWSLVTNSEIILDVPPSNASPIFNTYINNKYMMLKSPDLDAVYIWEISKLTGGVSNPAHYVIHDELYRNAIFSDNDSISASRDTTTPELKARGRVETTYYYYDFVTGETSTRTSNWRTWR